MAEIVVLGSCNTDLTFYVTRMPEKGETIPAKSFSTTLGGKGSNQAVAAALLGGKVAFIGKIGADSFGNETKSQFQKIGINSEYLEVSKTQPTGTACIYVDDQGENEIVTNSGANGEITIDELKNAEKLIKSAKIFISQLETPFHTTLQALKIAKANNVKTIFNAAPGVETLDAEVYPLVDIWCTNETETEIYTKLPVKTNEEAEAAAKALQKKRVQRNCSYTGCKRSLNS